MFFESIWEGAKFVGHWQVLLAGLFYVGLLIAFRLLIGTFTVITGNYGLGCLFQLLGETTLQGTLMGVMIAYLLPLMLGAPFTAPIWALGQYMWPLIKTGFAAIAAVTLLGLIPVVGPFVTSSAGVQAFLEGLIIFRLLSEEVIDTLLKRNGSGAQVYPDFLQSVGFLIISGILTRVTMVGLVILTGSTTDKTSPVVTIGGLAFSSIGGVLPLFMYSSYVRLMLQHALHIAAAN
jgi:hypothetical protein